MAFTDTLLSETADATVVMVDRNHAPGGHWHDAYPFVRLHQPSNFYGVNSRALGNDTIDQTGWNAGCYELASGSEVCAYFDQVMQQQFLPSGRVTYLPMCDYEGGGRVNSRLSKTEYLIVAQKTVDATYMHVRVPSQRPPNFDVAPGVICVPPNGLPRLAGMHSEYVIVGSGKTGIDACLFLLKHGVAPDAITWIMPADAWYFDRARVNPGRKFTDPIVQGRIQMLNAVLQSTSIEDLFGRVEALGEVLRLDDRIAPSRWRCATVTKAELEQLRRISNVVRMGRVSAVRPGEIVLENGTRNTALDALYVDCAADGLEKRPVRPVFDDNTITLQSLRMCQQVFSAALTAHVEANYTDKAKKNAICRPVPHPYTAEDYLRTAMQDSENLLEWVREPGIIRWLNTARLDGFTPVLDLESDDPELRAAIESMIETLTAAIAKLRSFLEGAAGSAPRPGF